MINKMLYISRNIFQTCTFVTICCEKDYFAKPNNHTRTEVNAYPSGFSNKIKKKTSLKLVFFKYKIVH